MRNEFNHCMYVLDERGEITHTNHMRVQEVKGRLQLGIVRPMDDARIRELQNATDPAEQGYLGFHGRPAEIPRRTPAFPTRGRSSAEVLMRP